MKTMVVTLVTFWCMASVWAHGGEDHGAPSAAPVQVGQAPRANAQTDEFELVAVLTPALSAESKTPPVLTLFLDRFATNQPVDGATVEVESGAFKAVATRGAPGVYTVPGQAFVKPGRYPLTVSVQADEGSDLMEATLQVDAPVAGEAVAVPAWRGRWAWGLGLILVLAIAGVALTRRRGGANDVKVEGA